jgi:signal transduction histidine kinase
MYAVARDVTELKQFEDSLRESEKKYRTLFDSIDEGFCIIEMIFDEQEKPVDYRFLEINPSFEKQTGLRNALGKRMRELAPQHEAHWFEIYGRIAVTGEAVRFQNRAEQLHRSYDVYAFRFGEPANRQVAILFSDITERKLREDDVDRLNAELSQRAAQLEAANKELEAFSYSVSHDLRAPLRTVDGFSQAALADYGSQLPEEGRRYLEMIHGGAQQMGQLIDDLLAFSQLGRQPLSKRTVDTAKLVREVLEDLSAQRDGRQIDIRIGDLPSCQGDPSLLKQVWINLLSNALKYSSKREKAVIEVDTTTPMTGSASDSYKVVYFVCDNGTGFDMRYADKLFGVFQRLHRAEEYEGTGVGLAIVQRIIHRHGGRIWAEAAPDRGATFYFTLEGEAKS